MSSTACRFPSHCVKAGRFDASLRVGRSAVRARAPCVCQAVSAPPVAQYTPYEANTWTLQLAETGVKILSDPWFEGTLTFADQSWFFEGVKPGLQKSNLDVSAVLQGVDFILLSQSLDDHTHRPTLRVLPKDIPIVAGPDAAEIARELGFKTVHALDHGQSMTLCDGKVTVKALVGALVGPPWSKRQNGWLLKEEQGVSVYYEPHASHDLSSVRAEAPVDIAILPTTSTYAGGYALVEGREGTPEALRALQAKVVVPLMNDSVDNTGMLSRVLSSAGTCDVQEVSKWLEQQGLSRVAVAGPQSFGNTVAVNLH